jgi:hypothetical protein
MINLASRLEQAGTEFGLEASFPRIGSQHELPITPAVKSFEAVVDDWVVLDKVQVVYSQTHRFG